MILAYHEITPEAGSSNYAYSLPAAWFREHLQVLSGNPGEAAEITFDDGHGSQFSTAAVLEQFGRRGIYFVTAGWTGESTTYMDWGQLRALSAAGHQVQAHGWLHKFLTHCSPQELTTELRHTREVLEDRLGRPVDALSAPGGRWNRHVAEACAQAGYRRLYVSDPWMAPTERYGIHLLGRYMVRRTMDGAGLRRLLAMPAAERRWQSFRYRAKEGMRMALGDTLYQRLWNLASRRPAEY